MPDNYQRVLIISLNAISEGASNNGKILNDFFSNWEHSCLAQFYVQNEQVNTNVCNNTYHITDKQALKSFFLLRKAKSLDAKTSNNTTASTKIRGNPLSRLIRDIVWNSGRWMGDDFWTWINEFNPEIIFVMVGGSTFIPNLAIKISKRIKKPIVVFNTENYYFKNTNYFQSKKFSFLYGIYHKRFKKCLRKLYKVSSEQIHLNEKLNALYKKEFGTVGNVIYQSSSLPKVNNVQTVRFKFSYIGNLFLNRHVTLLKIGEALSKLSSNFKLDVYGKAPNESIANELKNATGICYHGFVSYKEATVALKESNFLFHVESFDKKDINDLQTAFSTKIGDSLSSGITFILVADKSLACTQYLIDNDCAYVIDNLDSLEESLKKIIYNEELRTHYIKNALSVAQHNHSPLRNTFKLKSVFSKAMVNQNENMSN